MIAPRGNAVFAAAESTIFETMSRLARATGAVNLGQGFPDEPGPLALRQIAAAAVLDGPHQYPPMIGVPALREAVAALEHRAHGLLHDPDTEVLVTSGATEALLACFLGLLETGDEVLLLEPAYDTYAPVLRRIGCVPRPVRLAPPSWELPAEVLLKACTAKTRALVLNTPMNPTGKVFAADELAAIASVAETRGLVVICDEVYEHLVFPGARHVPLATVPGMNDRVVRIGSAGKTFSLTGWKVGYVSGPAALVACVARAHQLITFTTPPALQLAVAQGLADVETHTAGLAAGLARSCARLANGLAALGLPPLPVAGTYFLVADAAGWMRADEDDRAFARRLVHEAGVAVIPLSAFYEADAPRTLVRFCFCKHDATIDAALARLALWRAGRSPAAG